MLIHVAHEFQKVRGFSVTLLVDNEATGHRAVNLLRSFDDGQKLHLNSK